MVIAQCALRLPHMFHGHAPEPDLVEFGDRRGQGGDRIGELGKAAGPLFVGQMKRMLFPGAGEIAYLHQLCRRLRGQEGGNLRAYKHILDRLEESLPLLD
jgi:hypothetical protein